MKKIILAFIFLFSCLFFLPLNIKAASLETIISTFSYDAENVQRGQDKMILYTKNPNTNGYGYEILINEEGIVIEVGSNVTYQTGMKILSAHGTKKAYLENCLVGDIVEFVNKSVKISRNSLLSVKAQVDLSYKKAKDLFLNAKTNKQNIDIKKIDELFLKYETAYEEYQNAVNNFDSSLTGTSLQLALNKVNRKSNAVQDIIDEINELLVDPLNIEARAIWHRPNATSYDETTLSGLEGFVKHLSELNINMLFVETLYGGKAVYNSTIAEVHDKFKNVNYGEYGNDYLKALVAICNKYNIEVHSWCHMFNGSLSFDNSWLVENYEGDIAHPTTYGSQYYLDPSNPEVINYLCSILEELVTNYDIKGIQYDYIRYYDSYFTSTKTQDSGYSENSIKLFMNAYNLTGDLRTLLKKDSSVLEKWNKWRQLQITNAVKTFTNKVKSINKNVVVSADVVANITEAKSVYMQDWESWVNAGYIDMLCPMIYTGSYSQVATMVKQIKAKINGLCYLVAGIAPIYYGYDEIANKEEIIAATNAGASGSAMFATQNVINNATCEYLLKNGTNREKAASIFDSGRKQIEDTVLKIKDYLDVLYNQYNALNDVKYNQILGFLNQILSSDLYTPTNWLNSFDHFDSIYALFYGISQSSGEIVEGYINNLKNSINLKITRLMINNGYYNPLLDDKMDDISNYTFELEDDTREKLVLEGILNSNNGNTNNSSSEIKNNGCSCNSLSLSIELISFVFAIGLTCIIIKKRN